MPYEIINRLRAPSLLRVTGVTNTGALALSAFSANVGTENVTSLILTSVKWAVAPTGTLVITRDSLVVATLYGEGDWQHNELNIANTAAGTFTAEITVGGTCLIGLRKEAVYNVSTQSL